MGGEMVSGRGARGGRVNGQKGAAMSSASPAAPPPSSTLLTWCLRHALLTASTLRPVVTFVAEAESMQALAMAATLLRRGHGKVVRGSYCCLS